MAIWDLFSRRKRHERGELPDVYQYDELPEKLRIQIVHVWEEAIGPFGKSRIDDDPVFDEIVSVLRKELGVFALTGDAENSSFNEIVKWFLKEKNIDYCLDAVELTCWIIDNVIRKSANWKPRPKTYPADALEEINQRFKDSGIGFQYESGKIIKIDSQFVHSTVVKPLLALIQNKHYKIVNEEFLKAHEYYRKGEFGNSNIECLKAFESTMKIICQKRNWGCSHKDTAKLLLAKIFENNLIPSFLQSQFSSLRSVLEGAAAVRNNMGGHGQGAQPLQIPEYFAQYQINQTAAAILFLIQAEKELGKSN